MVLQVDRKECQCKIQCRYRRYHNFWKRQLKPNQNVTIHVWDPISTTEIHPKCQDTVYEYKKTLTKSKDPEKITASHRLVPSSYREKCGPTNGHHPNQATGYSTFR